MFTNDRYKPDGQEMSCHERDQKPPRATRRFTEGTIQYDLENIGRHLLSVEWENGVTDYVYPVEIEILDEEEPLSVDVKETWREPAEFDEDGRRVVTREGATWN